MPRPLCITPRVAFFVIATLLCLFAALPHAFIITPIQPTNATNTWAFTIYGSSDVIDAPQPVSFTKLAISQLNALDTTAITLNTATIEVYSKKDQQVIIPPTTASFKVIDTIPTVEIEAPTEQPQPPLHDDTIFYSLRIILTTTNTSAAADTIAKFQITTTTSNNKEVVANGETKFLWTQPTAQLFPRSTRQYHPNVVKPVRTIDSFETKLIAFATHNPKQTPTAYIDVVVAAPWKINLGTKPSCFINGNNYTAITLRPQDAEIGAVSVLRVQANAKGNTLQIPHGLPFSLECDDISFTPYAAPTNLTTTTNSTYRTAYSGDLIVTLYDQDGVVHDVFASESVQQSVVQVAFDRFPSLTESNAHMGINLLDATKKSYRVYRTYNMIYPLGTKNMIKTNDSFVQLSAQLTSSDYQYQVVQLPDLDTQSRYYREDLDYDNHIVYSGQTDATNQNVWELSMKDVFSGQGKSAYTQSQGHTSLILEFHGNFQADATPTTTQDVQVGMVLLYKTNCVYLDDNNNNNNNSQCLFPLNIIDDEYYDNTSNRLPRGKINRISYSPTFIQDGRPFRASVSLGGDGLWPTAPDIAGQTTTFTLRLSSRTGSTKWGLKSGKSKTKCFVREVPNGDEDYNQDEGTHYSRVDAIEMQRNHNIPDPENGHDFYEELFMTFPLTTNFSANLFVNKGDIRLVCPDSLYQHWPGSHVTTFSYAMTITQTTVRKADNVVVDQVVRHLSDEISLGYWDMEMIERVLIIILVVMLVGSILCCGCCCLLCCCGFQACASCFSSPKRMAPPPPPQNPQMGMVGSNGYQQFHDARQPHHQQTITTTHNVQSAYRSPQVQPQQAAPQ